MYLYTIEKREAKENKNKSEVNKKKKGWNNDNNDDGEIKGRNKDEFIVDIDVEAHNESANRVLTFWIWGY